MLLSTTWRSPDRHGCIRRAIILPFSLLVAAAALSACWMPPFDAGLSASRLTVGKLSPVGSFGPVSFSDESVASSGVGVYAELARSPTWAFVQLTRADYSTVCYLTATGLMARTGMSMGDDAQADSVPFACAVSGPALVAKGPTPTGYAFFRQFAYTASLTVSDLSAYAYALTGTFGTTGEVQATDLLAVARQPDAGSFGVAYFLGMTPAGSLLEGEVASLTAAPQATVNVNTSRTASASSPAVSIPSPFPAAGELTTYVFLPGPSGSELADGVSFASTRIDGTWQTWRWQANDAHTDVVSGKLSLKQPVTAALSDGRVIAEGKTVTTVLNSDGTVAFSFPSGNLRFVHEVIDTDAALTHYLLFAVHSWTTDSWTHARKLAVELYEVRLSDFATLAG